MQSPQTKLAFSLLILVALFQTSQAGADGKCRAIVFQGSGDFASYEAGVFKALAENLSAQDASYDVVGGTGFGTINMAILASHAIGDEASAAEAMVNFFTNAKSSDFYNSWPFSIPQAIISEYGLYDSSPFTKTMENLLSSKKAQRMVNLVTADANTGKLVRFDETSLKSSMSGVYVAASSFPGVFPHYAYNGMTLVDASVMNSLDIGGAITRCRNKGYSDKNIIVDLVMTSSSSTKEEDCSKYNSISMIGRLISVYSYSFVSTDLYHSLANYKDVNFRYLVKPSATPYYNINPYTFDSADMTKAINLGYEDGKKAIQKGKESRIEAFEEAEQLMEKVRPGRATRDVSHVYREFPEPQYTLQAQ